MVRLSDIEEKFSERLKKELDIRGHGSQTELARKIGVSVSRLNGIVTKYRGSNEQMRRKICDALGVDYEEFCGIRQSAMGTNVSQVAGNGNSVSIKSGDGLNDLERKVIEGIRLYGNRTMLEGILQKIEEMKNISKF